MGRVHVWQQWICDSLRGSIAALCSCLFVGVLLVELAACGLAQAGLGSTQAAPTVTQAGAKMIGNAATLGGTEQGFTAAYGAPIRVSNTEVIYTSQTQEAQLDITVNSATAKDGSSHIYSIDLAIKFSSGAWHEDAVEGTFRSFLPSDSVHVRDVQQSGVIEQIFLSANLGATFPASSFEDDASQNVLPPGTFDAICEPVATGLGTCIIARGGLGSVSAPCSAASSQPGLAAIPCSTPTSTPRPRATKTPITVTPTERPTPVATSTSTPIPSPTVPFVG